MDQLYEVLLFGGKLIMTLVFLGALLVLILTAAGKAKHRPQIEVEDINEKFDHISDLIKSYVLDKKDLKSELKLQKKVAKKANKPSKNIYVLDFNGDVKASQVNELREEVTAILHVAKPGDDVLVRIESPGGVVHGYGLAAAQLKRLKDADLKVIAAVDKVAASGGYMMACTANHIIAAPFAIVGSIGVIAQLPNFNRLLKKHDVDYEEVTSGEFKRTVSLFGEITEKGRKKFTEQIEDTHQLFKEFVKLERPVVDLAESATGEYWFGERALKLKLIDEISTSDDFLFKNRKLAKIIRIKFLPKQSLAEKLQGALGKSKLNLFERNLPIS